MDGFPSGLEASSRQGKEGIGRAPEKEREGRDIEPGGISELKRISGQGRAKASKKNQFIRGREGPTSTK